NAAFCAEAVGALRQQHALTMEYAKTRKQFGRAIAEFQVLQHRLVDMFMAVEESASIALLATLKLDTPERAKHVSAAKAKIGRAIRFVGENAIQTHGGMGVTDEMRVGHYFKRATMIDAQFGNADHHLKRFMALSKVA
ncbi:MAG: acyl-CoA dehydrogenase family protein, partial [Pseudomonadota bacterium]